MRYTPIARHLLGLLFAAAFLTPIAGAADFPLKPVRLIVGYSPGGATDLVARMLARTLSERWPHPVVVENRPGAAGNIAADLIAKAPADGHTLILAAPALAVNASLYKRLPFDPIADFRQVGIAAVVMNVFVVAPSLPVRSVGEFIAYAKRHPGEMNFVSSGVGASSHLGGELFKSLTGIDMVHVPYKGTSAYVADLASGKVHAAFDSLPALLAQVQSGKLRALALSSPSRSPLLPEVPTMQEAGLPDYRVSVWLGVMGPAKMPDSVVAQLNRDINAALQDPALQKQVADIGGVVGGGTPEAFAALYRDEIARYREVILRTGASAD